MHDVAYIDPVLAKLTAADGHGKHPRSGQHFTASPSTLGERSISTTGDDSNTARSSTTVKYIADQTSCTTMTAKPAFVPPHLRPRDLIAVTKPVKASEPVIDETPLPDWTRVDGSLKAAAPAAQAIEARVATQKPALSHQHHDRRSNPTVESRSIQDSPNLLCRSEAVADASSPEMSIDSQELAKVIGLPKKKPKRYSKKPRPAKSGWAKNSDIPKGVDPKKKTSKWKDADARSRLSGWATHEEDVEELGLATDWQGNLYVVPNWCHRKSFYDAKLERTIQTWMRDTERALEDFETTIDLRVYHQALMSQPCNIDELSELLGPIVPEYWIPTRIGTSSPAVFWKKFLKNHDITTIDEGDLDHAVPWWLEFPPYGDAFVHKYECPHILGVDPDETVAERTARKNDQGANKAIERIRQVDLRKSKPRQRYVSPTSPTPTRSDGMHIRLANREDMAQLCDIVNHYIMTTHATDETVPITELVITKRWRTGLELGLPMLVACQAVAHHRGREVQIPDKAVGFAFATDYPLRRDFYQYTKRLQVFVHPKHTGRGIARALLDKLIQAVDPTHVEQTTIAADILPDQYNTKLPEIRSVIIQYFFADAERMELERMSKWLREWYRFGQPSVARGIAWKGKRLSMATFQRDIGNCVPTTSGGEDAEGYW